MTWGREYTAVNGAPRLVVSEERFRGAVRMTEAELAAAQARQRAAYAAWKAAQPPRSPEVFPTEIVASDGSRWRVGAAGTLERAP